MISSRILEIIDSLSAGELERLLLFLQSPYHNSGYNSEKIVDMFEYVQTAYQNGETKLLSKEHLNKRYYPEHPFVERKKNPIDALSSDLFKKMKAFLFIEYVQTDAFNTHQLLSQAKFYRKNNFEERFWQVVKQFRKMQERRQQVDAFYYLDSLLMETEVASFRSIFNTYTDDANLNTTHQLLDQFYATLKLEYSAILVFQQKLGQASEDETKQMGALIEQVYEEYELLHTPLADLYKVILGWLRKTPSNEELEAFAKELKLQRGRVEPEKYRNLMAFYRYFLGMKYRKEVAGIELLRKIFVVYQEHLKEGYFLVDDKLLPVSLNSIITIGTKLGEIKWAKQVLKQYGPEKITGTRYPEEAHSICEAEVLFANQEYTVAQNKLAYCNFENVHYSILADVLLIKTYYATDDELIYARIQALDRKVRRSKLAETNKTSYLNFLQLLNRILKYEHDKRSKTWQKLAEELTTTTPMIEREWLKKIME